MPVLVTPENWCIADSTPIFQLLDGRLPNPKLCDDLCFPADCVISVIVFFLCFSSYPPGLVGSLSAICEEYFDEWIPRLAIHARWNFEASGKQAARRLTAMAGIPTDSAQHQQAADMLRSWGGRAARAIGVSSVRQRAAADEEMLRVFGCLDEQLGQSHEFGPFIFGQEATSLDFVVGGALKAHFLYDAAPSSAFSAFAHLPAYCARLEQPATGAGEEAAPARHSSSGNVGCLPPFVAFILREMRGAFTCFAEGNGRALAAKAKFFKAHVYGEEVSYLARPYVEKSHRMLLQHLTLREARDARTAAAVVGADRSGDDLLEGVLKRFGLQKRYGIAARRAESIARTRQARKAGGEGHLSQLSSHL